MLKRLWCWLWGHKFIKSKETILSYRRVEYEYKFNDRCPRCGKSLIDKE